MRNPVFAERQVESRVSPEEYLESERESDFRHEFIDGWVFAMAGESLSHCQVCTNLSGEARTKLKGTSCQPLSPNMKVRTSTASLFAYPDLTIVCNEPLFHDAKKDVLINPKVIFEVLSPSTEKYDRTTKFARYRMGNETLTDYVLVSQDKPFVEHFSKQLDGNWLYRSFSELADSFEIASIECSLSLDEIYDRVEFEPLNEPEH
jgi:Uma2 family endonuclease